MKIQVVAFIVVGMAYSLSHAQANLPCRAVEGSWSCQSNDGFGKSTKTIKFLNPIDVEVMGELNKITGVPEHTSPQMAPKFYTVTTCTVQGLKVYRGIDPSHPSDLGVVWRFEPRQNGNELRIAIEYGTMAKWAGDNANTYDCSKVR